MKKLIDFKSDTLVGSIQKYADKFCEGNFNMAVRMLTKNALDEDQEKADLREALNTLVFKDSQGNYLTGLHGDSDVTDIVKELLNK